MDPKLEIPTFNLLEFQVTYKTNKADALGWLSQPIILGTGKSNVLVFQIIKLYQKVHF